MPLSDDTRDGRRSRQPPSQARGSGPARTDAGPQPPERTFRVIRGEGQGRKETLQSRDDVARLLVGAACDLLLKRISSERAHEIELRVDRVMRLFDRVPADPIATALLRRELDELEGIWREGSERRRLRR